MERRMPKLVHHEDEGGWSPSARKRRKKKRKRQNQNQGARLLMKRCTKRLEWLLGMRPCLAGTVMRKSTIGTIWSQEPIRISVNLGEVQLNHCHLGDPLLLRLLAKLWRRLEWCLPLPLLSHEKVDQQSNGLAYSSLSPGRWRMLFIWLRPLVDFTLLVRSEMILQVWADVVAVPLRPKAPKVFVVSWLDYCTKYGMGFAMADGTVCVHFNDSSSFVLAPGKQYVPPWTPRES
jgi:hypothetical protein